MFDDLHERYVVKVEFPVFSAEFVLRKLEGLVDQIKILVSHLFDVFDLDMVLVVLFNLVGFVEKVPQNYNKYYK